MGQLVPFPASQSLPRVAQGLAGDVPIWRATAECRSDGRIRSVSCTLVQPEPGRIEFLGANVGGESRGSQNLDPCTPDAAWGDLSAALVGLWVDVPETTRSGLHIVHVDTVIGSMIVQAALTVEARGVRSIMWTAHTEDTEIFGRIDALVG